MQDNDYRKALNDATETLYSLHQQLSTKVVNLTMQGELKKFNEQVEPGEIYQIDKKLLEACDDQNIQLLTELLTKIRHTHESLTNLNNLSSDHD